MEKVVFMTGFPGFLATRLWKALQQQNEKIRFVMLVHPSQYKKAKTLVENDERVKVFIGDITKGNLGLEQTDLLWLQENVTHVYHLAAIYDLAVPQSIAYQVNVTGTQHINEMVKSCTQLHRYIYFSTAYVSGNRKGKVTEAELDVGQSFKNHYEKTKFLAEKLVRELENIPTIIIRPGIVVGHSKTGETEKFDGPYFILRFLDRFRILPIPYLGKGNPYFNIVPVDYLIQATIYLANLEGVSKETFYLTDPHPRRAQEVYQYMCEALLSKRPSWRVPMKLVYWFLSIGPIRRWVGVEREALDYFLAQSEYDAEKTASILAQGNICCPDISTYIPNIVQYYQEHRKDQTKMIEIK